MDRHNDAANVLRKLGFLLSHGLVTLLAVGIALTLPSFARFILYQWWPRVEADTSLLLTTELALACVLILMFNVARAAWDNRYHASSARLAALVDARGSANSLSRYRLSSRNLPVSRDAFVLAITGFDTFAHDKSLFRKAVGDALEVRVMLLNPVGPGAQQRLGALPADKYDRRGLCTEIETSIAYLDGLRRAGKRVALRLYDHPPFWKVVVLGDRVWVQYCHSGCKVREIPEYGFELDRRDPRRGLFVPFYMHFLDKWNESWHPEYDFDSKALVYRDSGGNELRRMPFTVTGTATGRDLPADVA